MHFITLPGINGSGPAHWQTAWEQELPSISRFQPRNWDEPELADWIDALNKSISETAEDIVLIAHSLSCLLVAHWSAQSKRKVKGAMLVAVPDPQGPEFPKTEAKSFINVPETALSFPSLIVASSNDAYGTAEYAKMRSTQWKSGFVQLGELGHLSSASNLGNWKQGKDLLTAFCAGLGLR